MFEIAMTRPHHLNRDPFFNLVDRFFTDNSSTDHSCSTVAKDVSEQSLDSTPKARSWVPPVDIVESTQAFLVTADLPGLSKDDLDISLEANLLTVSGERTYANDDADSKFRRVERAHGSFKRSFRLPTGVDSSKVEARFENGVLTLTLPKAEVALSRKIEVA